MESIVDDNGKVGGVTQDIQLNVKNTYRPVRSTLLFEISKPNSSTDPDPKTDPKTDRNGL